MIHLIEKLPSELINHEPNSNQFNLVFDKIVHKLFIFYTIFDTALTGLIPRSLTGKSNGFFLYKINTTNLSNVLR